MEKEHPSFKSGAMLGKHLMHQIQEIESEHSTPEEKLLFFAGLMGHLSGQMCAVIGGEASQVLLGAMRPIITSVVADHKAARH